MRSTLAAVLFAVGTLAVGMLAVGVAPAAAQSDPTSTTAPDIPSIIPRPNEGVEPTDAGDRGGGLQTAVFVLVLAGTLVIGGLVVRESRKARAERGF